MVSDENAKTTGSARVSRRRFLTAGAIAGAAVSVAGSATQRPAGASTDPSTATAHTIAPLYGRHQATLMHDPAPATAVVAFDVTAATRADVRELFQAVTERARLLSAGEPAEPSDPSHPPADNGVLGPTVPGGLLGIVVGVGASLFDDRYGLAASKPAGLTPMRTFPNDNLDPDQTHGDMSIQFTAGEPDIVAHAIRDITKYTRGGMQPRWRIDGFSSPPRPSGTPRNLFGFKDGIANPDVSDPAVAGALIWLSVGGDQPVWTSGGTFQVVRIIRHLSEFWDRVSLAEQELMIGRRRDSGAPLDADGEFDTPDYRNDPQGQVIPLDAHIRLANPRTAATEKNRILRRGWNYDLGLDSNGNLNQGMIFTCYQQDLQRQFETVQARLIDEPLVDYVSPVGGGYFFVLPGLRDRSDYYARALLMP